jgi:transcriptional regulator with XRE-family HTH domain
VATAAEPGVRAPDLTRRVRAARAYSGLSVQELATAIGVGAQTIKRIEAGRRTPRQMEVSAIADVCGLPHNWFSADWASCCQQVEALSDLMNRLEQRQIEIGVRLGIDPVSPASG